MAPRNKRRPNKSRGRHASQGGRRQASRQRRAESARTIERASESDERLQKVLASAGIASRRECEELIREGRVEVDRTVVTELGTRVDRQQVEIRVDGEVLHKPKLVYFAVNKPAGVVSTSRDPAGRPRVTDLLPPNVPRSFCVGRLDLTSEGLILVTNDGELANQLTHPRHGVEKTYEVQVAGEVEREAIGKLERGVRLAEGFAHAKRVRIKGRRKNSTVLEMVLDEGRNREIRRLLARLGHKVQRLRRIAVGPLRLGDMPLGAVRPLERRELAALRRAVARGAEASQGEKSRRPRRVGRPAAADKPAERDRRRTLSGQKGHTGKRRIVGDDARERL